MNETIRGILIGISLVIFAVVGWKTLRRRGDQTPLSERACKRTADCGRWLLDVSQAWDRAIVGYRADRRVRRPQLMSTAERGEKKHCGA